MLQAAAEDDRDLAAKRVTACEEAVDDLHSEHDVPRPQHHRGAHGAQLPLILTTPHSLPFPNQFIVFLRDAIPLWRVY